MKKLSIIFILNFFFSLHCAFAQTPIIDSLKLRISNSKSPDQKLAFIEKLCAENYSLSSDTLARYINLGLSLTEKFSPTYFKLKNYYTFYFLKLSETKEANRFIDSLYLEANEHHQESTLLLEILFSKSVSLIRHGSYKESIDTSLSLLGQAEKLNETTFMLKAYNQLGWANMELENEKLAIPWFWKGLALAKKTNQLKYFNSYFLNLSSCYRVLENVDSSFYYIEQGLKYTKEVQNLTNEANALNIRASVFSKINRNKEALADLEDATNIRAKVGDMHYLIGDLGVLAKYYAYTNQTKKGISTALKGIELAKKINNPYKLIFLKKCLAYTYDCDQQYQQEINVLEDIIKLKDSLYEVNSAQDIAELTTKYELQKKESIILLQKQNLLQSRYTIYASMLAFILGSLILWLVYKNYQHRQRLKLESIIAEEKLNTIQAVQKAEENERKRIALDLHDNLGSYAAAITSNIRLLKEKLPDKNEELIQQLDSNAQNIVSQLSDSIWVLKNEQLPLTKLADRFKSWTQRMIQNFPNVKYEYEEHIAHDIILSPSRMINLFLILKEALNNSLKHSNCNEIKIQFYCDEFLKIIFEDDGIGFDMDEVSLGSGIQNMIQRAKDSGMKISIQHKPKGTRIVLQNNTQN